MLRHFGMIGGDPTLRMVALATLLFGVFPASVGIYQSLLAVTVFGLSDGMLALVLMGAMLASVGASVGVGIVTDQRPSRRIMALVAVASLGVGGATMVLVPGTMAFTIVHVAILPLSSTLFGQIFAVARLVMADWDRTDRDAILAIVRALFAVPFVVVLPLWGLAFDRGLALTAVYPAMMLLCGALLWLVLTSWPRDEAAPWLEQKSGLGFRASLGELLAPAVILRVALIGAIHSGSALSGVIVALIFEQTEGRGTMDTGLFFALFVAVEVVVTLQLGLILRRARRLHVIAAGVFIYATFLVFLPVLAASPWVWALIVPAGAGGALFYALAIGYLQDLLGSRAGAGASLIALQRIASDGLSALVFWVGAALGGYGLASMLGAVVIVLAMIAILILDRHRP